MPFLRPTADAADGNWTTDLGGTDLFAAIDEDIVSDADFLRSGVNPVADTFSVALSAAPSVDTAQPVTVRYRYAMGGPGPLRIDVRLKEGVATIAEWTHTDAAAGYVTAAQILTVEQKAAISDWSALSIEISATTSAFTNEFTAEFF